MRLLCIIPFIILFISCRQNPSDGEDEQVKVDDQEVENQMDDSLTLGLQNINQALREDVNNQNLYLERARLYVGLKDFNSAIADAERALAIDSSNTDAYIILSEIYSKNGQMGEVKETLERGLRAHPDNSELHVKLGELYFYVKNNKKSLEQADEAIKYDIYNAQAYYLKGFNFLEMRDTAKAISSFQTAVEQDPDFIDAYLQLGLIYSLKNDPLALAYINNVLELDSNHKEALYSYAMYAQEHQMYNEAIKAYTKLAKIYPHFREAYYNLGYIHMYYLQLYREATYHFTDAIEVDPNYYQAYYNRGYSFELMGDIRNAELDYKKALSIKPDYDLAAKGLSRVEELAKMDV